MIKPTLEFLIDVESALRAVETIRELKISTIMKVATLEEEIETLTKPFHKTRDKAFEKVALDDKLIEGWENSPKFVVANLQSGARIVIETKEFIRISGELQAELDKEVSFETDVEFDIEEFEYVVYTDTGEKKKEKQKKSLINALILKNLKPFIKEKAT